MRHLLLVVGCVAAACGKSAPPAPPTPPAPEAIRGQACEVEMGGRVDQTVTGNRMIAIYVASDDCTKPDARIITRAAGKGDGSFFAEAWVPCGTQLSLCAAVEARAPYDGEPKPTRRWGKLDRPLLAQGQGEIEFFGLSWALQDHADERTFARPRPLLRPPSGHTPRQ